MSTPPDPTSSHRERSRQAVRFRARNLTIQVGLTLVVLYLSNALFSLALVGHKDGPSALLQGKHLADAFVGMESSFFRTQLPLVFGAAVGIELFLIGYDRVAHVRQWLDDRRFKKDVVPQARADAQRARVEVEAQFFDNIDRELEALKEATQQPPFNSAATPQENASNYRQQIQERIGALNQQTDTVQIPRIRELMECERILEAMTRGDMTAGQGQEALANLHSLAIRGLERFRKQRNQQVTREKRLVEIGAWFTDDPDLMNFVQDEITARRRKRWFLLLILGSAAAAVGTRVLVLMTTR